VRINVVIEGHAYPAQVPPDMRIADFIDEIREQMSLSDTGWLLRDKNGRKPLDPDKTLEENGVEEGQNIFAERVAPPRKVDIGKPVPVSELPATPVVSGRRPSARWATLPLAFAIVAVAFAALGYALGDAKNTSSDRELTRVRAELQKARESTPGRPDTAQLQEATQKLNDERAQHLDQIAKANAETTGLQQKLVALTREVIRLRTVASESEARATKAQAEVDSIRQADEQAKGSLATALKAQRDAEARAAEAQAGARQLELQLANAQKTMRRRPWSVLRWRVDRLRSGSVVDIYRNRASAGDITVVAGEVPFGVPGQVIVGNPEIAEIRMQPGATDQYSRLQVVLKKSGRQDVLFFWGAM
jgi:hypothetical protein